MSTMRRALPSSLTPGGPLILIEEGVERDVVRQIITYHIDVPSHVTTSHPKWDSHLAAMMRTIEEQLVSQGWQFDGSPFWLCGRGCTCSTCSMKSGLIIGHNARCTYCDKGFIVRGPKPVFPVGTITKPVSGNIRNGFQPTTAEFARTMDYDQVELSGGSIRFVPSQTELHSYWLTAMWRRRGVRIQLDPDANVLIRRN